MALRKPSIAEKIKAKAKKSAERQGRNNQIFRSYVFGPSGLKDYGYPTLHCKMRPHTLHPGATQLKEDITFCAPTPSTLAQSKERKGSNFAIWQPCSGSYSLSLLAATSSRVWPPPSSSTSPSTSSRRSTTTPSGRPPPSSTTAPRSMSPSIR